MKKLLLTLALLLSLTAKAWAACDANTQLMCHMNTGAGTTPDVSSNANTCTINVNGAISAVQSKLGGSSFNANTTGYVSIPHAAWMDFGTGDFTLEAYVYLSTDTPAYIFGRVNGVGNACDIYYDGANIRFYIMTNLVLSNAWTKSTATWYHIAVVRSGTTCYIFVDGTQLGATGTNSSNISETTAYNIGGYSGGTTWQGYIDEVRMSNTARYTANFTPPAAEFCGASSNTSSMSACFE